MNGIHQAENCTLALTALYILKERNKFEINLQGQEMTILSTGEKEIFEINPYKKECLINGYDDFDYLVSMKDKIKEFEQSRG